MYKREYIWARKMHPKKPKYWRQERYFGKLNLDREDKWVFGDVVAAKQKGAKNQITYLQKFNWFPIERHALIQGNASPDDASLKGYWEKRNLAKVKDLSPSLERIARKQKGRCLRCGDTLFNGEELHKHHKQWKSKGGKDTYANLELVHLFCHQQIHAMRREGSPEVLEAL